MLKLVWKTSFEGHAIEILFSQFELHPIVNKPTYLSDTYSSDTYSSYLVYILN